ncbi:MAG: IS30 family transposase [Acidimicrobiales bacterium]|nr:IS30 family transposase [Acidimicrobiales bacterium]
MPPYKLTTEQARLVLRLGRLGWNWKSIAREAGCDPGTVRWVRPDEPRRPFGWTPGPGRLSAADREEITIGLAAGESLSVIARRMAKSPSTVSREVAANGGRERYRAWAAHRRARERVRRPKASKLAHPPLRALVSAWLGDFFSPEEIAARLRLEFPDDPMMQVSHETIYRSLFVQGRGELRRELARCLRSGRATRTGRGRGRPRGGGSVVSDMVMITERPAEVEDRAVPGHWEGDLLMGADNRSAVGTLVERSTRYVLLLHLGKDKSAAAVASAMRSAIATLPAEMVRSITWDQGSEMARHRDFTIATGIPIYFCDPHAPWQRGSNENTNGLLRQYMPKGTDLSRHSAEDLERFQRSINRRPRKTLGYLTPSEKLAELVADTG